MKKLLLGGVALVALAVPLAANAADLSRPAAQAYKAPLPIPVTTWTGPYLGIYGGGGWGTSSATSTVTGLTTGNFNTSGGEFGGTGGYNWQSGAAVFGIEADGGWADIRGNAPCPPAAAGFTCAVSDRWLSTVRGRLGWAVGSNLLIYGTGGGAFGDVRTSVTPGFPGATGERAGWSAGAGLEWMFAPNWSAKVEYLHYDLGTFSCTVGCATAATSPINWRFFGDTARAGLNYHFNWGPAMGRY